MKTQNKIFASLQPIFATVKKKKSTWTKFFGETNERCLIIDFPNETFGYKENENESSPYLMEFGFDDLVGITTHLTEDDVCICDWEYGFKLATKNKEMTIYCQEEE